MLDSVGSLPEKGLGYVATQLFKAVSHFKRIFGFNHGTMDLDHLFVEEKGEIKIGLKR
jgi:hypothetical protein